MIVMRRILMAGCVAALAGVMSTGGASAQTVPPPAEVDVVVLGKVGAVTVLTYPARFVSADPQTREAVFESADGKRWELVIPPGVADLAALQNSEKVVIRLLPAVVSSIDKATQGTPGEVETQVTGNDGMPGLPDGFGLLSVTLTTTFIGIDKAAGTVTFEGPDGKVRTVRAFDPKVLADLQKVEPGDLSKITYVEGIAITTP